MIILERRERNMSTVQTIKGRIQNKHDTEAGWILSVYTDATKTELRSNPFIPLVGELIIYDPDSVYHYPRFKIGNGLNNVVELPFGNNIASEAQILAMFEEAFEDIDFEEEATDSTSA
jgi:hypothetical protein